MKMHVVAALAFASASAAASAQVWGTFGPPRVYTNLVLTSGMSQSLLAGMITSSGATIATPTERLTAEYLSGIDVFYTSRLDYGATPLSPAEQADLQAWFNAGGTLIVTVTGQSLLAHDSITSFLGITNYERILGAGGAVPVANHLITARVGPTFFNARSTFTYPPTARRIMADPVGGAFCVVMDPASGFQGPGRVAVFGDHNPFMDNFVAHPNGPLAQNLVAWANTGGVAPCQADLTAGVVAGQAGYGVPDGLLDNDDFFYYLAQFATGNVAVCDMTSIHIPGTLGYGVPNGVLNTSDFSYYLAIFTLGC